MLGDVLPHQPYVAIPWGQVYMQASFPSYVHLSKIDQLSQAKSLTDIPLPFSTQGCLSKTAQ